MEIATGKVLRTHIVRYGIGGVEFSHDGRELVALGCCASGSTVVAWDAHSGRQLFMRAAGVHATAIDIAPDSRLLGVGTEDGRVLLLDARSGSQIQPPIRAAAANIEQVAYSPDGRSFAAAAVDGATSLWDLRSRKRVGNPFPPSPGAIPDLAFEANGRLLIVGVSNAVEWPTDVRTWERFACHAAGRDLTRAEWHDLVPNRAYRPACPA